MARTKDKASKSFDRLKQSDGRRYSGMKVGASHRWAYDQGEWRERKLTPDEWEIYYQTTKRRAAKAPDESGAPIGTQYNWLIVSHQRVDKLDSNSYMTCMEGKKFKVAHKRASKEKWSASEKSQRQKVIRFLEQVIQELKQADEEDPVPYAAGERDRVYGINLRTKAELYTMAKDLHVSAPSKMKREELLRAVKQKLKDQGSPASPKQHSATVAAKTRADQQPETNGKKRKADRVAASSQTLAHLQDKAKNDLYQLAKKRDIAGRSEMSKAELLSALKREMSRERPHPR